MSSGSTVADVDISKTNEAAQVIFAITLYVSFASVLCTVLLIRRIARELLVYIAPAIVAVVGLLLASLPTINCDDRHIFPSMTGVCSTAVSVLRT
jgi:hypothetical protein